MDTDAIQTIIAILGAIGGWETIRYFINRKQNRRKAEAEADSAEFHVLQETMMFLQAQLLEKERRFAEQTDLVRRLNADTIELTKKCGALELELALKRCNKRKCGDREPPNGY